MCGEEKEEVEEAGGGGGKKGLMRKVNFSDVRQVLTYIYVYMYSRHSGQQRYSCQRYQG